MRRLHVAGAAPLRRLLLGQHRVGAGERSWRALQLRRRPPAVSRVRGAVRARHGRDDRRRPLQHEHRRRAAGRAGDRDAARGRLRARVRRRSRSQVQAGLVSYEFVNYEKRGRIAYITIDRPEVMNALHLEAHLELTEIWEDFRDDPELWVAILSGAGERAFSAGNDLKATAERTAAGTDVQGRARPPFGRITRDFDCPKPMIAAVNGVAVGGGLELALACDLVIAADHARFGLPEPRVGLFAGAGGIHRIARQVPFKHAMGLLLTGRIIQADEAYRIGLVNEVVPVAELMPAAERWAAEILECSPLSLRLTKEAALDGLQHSVDEALARDRGRVA